MTDATTIEAARRGDRQAQARLLTSLQDTWFRFCLSFLRNEDRAADATQETGLRFLRRISSFRGESQLKAWSLGIALNVVREIKRRRIFGDDEALDQIAVEYRSTGLSDVEQSEMKEILRSTMKDLPDRQREAIVLRFFEDLSVEETATAMGCATGTVKATVHQALRALKEKMKSMR